MIDSLTRRAAATPRVSLKSGRLYWQPSAALRRRGWTGQSLGVLSAAHLNAADELNAGADAALAAEAAAAPAPETLAGLVRAFQASEEWQALRARTRRDYARHLARATADLGERLADQLTGKQVKAWHGALGGGRDAYNHVASLRALFAWATTAGRARGNPAAGLGIRKPASHKRVGERAELWALVEAADALGRPSVAVAAVLLAATMQRPADVLALTTRQVRAGVLRLTQFKTGAELAFALHPVAAERLGHLGDNGAPLVVNERTGAAYTERAFERAWAAARARAAERLPSIAGADQEVQDPTRRGPLNAAHMRRTGMVWAAEAGAKIDEICSVSGHDLSSGMQILETYLPRQRLLADRAITRLDLHRAPSLADMSATLLPAA